MGAHLHKRAKTQLEKHGKTEAERWKGKYKYSQRKLKQTQKKVDELVQEVIELRGEIKVRRDGVPGVSGARAKY